MKRKRTQRWKLIAATIVTVALLAMVSGCPDGSLLDLVASADENGDGGGNDVAPPSQYESPNIGTMNRVPGGVFQRDNIALNTTLVSPFYMSNHQITRAQFETIMGTDPSDPDYSSGTSDPVQMVSWYDAIAFCNKLSLAEGKTPVYSVSGVNWSILQYDEIPTTNNSTWNAATMNMAASGYRLPTEAEWMWAAMGADQDAQPGAMQGGINRTGYEKPFSGYDGSNAIGDYAVFGYYGTSEGRTTNQRTDPVGSKLPNELGLYDMSGNVWDWTWDWQASYPPGQLNNYEGPEYGSHRVYRGGGWNYHASGCGVAFRHYATYYSPSESAKALGFRVVSR